MLYQFLTLCSLLFFFFFNDTATTEIYTLSLHDALPICSTRSASTSSTSGLVSCCCSARRSEEHTSELQSHVNLVCRLLLEKKNFSQHVHNTVSPKEKSAHDDVYLRQYRFYRSAADSAVGDAGCGFFFNDTATTEIYTLSLHDALPI